MPNSSKRRLNSSKLLSKLSLSSVPREKFGELFEVGSSEDLCFMGCHLHTVVVPGGVHEGVSAHAVQEAEVHRLGLLALIPSHLACRLTGHLHRRGHVDVLVVLVEADHRGFTSNRRSHSQLDLRVVTLEEDMTRCTSEDALYKLVSRNLLKVHSPVRYSTSDLICIALSRREASSDSSGELKRSMDSVVVVNLVEV